MKECLQTVQKNNLRLLCFASVSFQIVKNIIDFETRTDTQVFRVL